MNLNIFVSTFSSFLQNIVSQQLTADLIGLFIFNILVVLIVNIVYSIKEVF